MNIGVLNSGGDSPG
ncbi:hypothetical protein, partial [Akkermansia sp.]